MAPATPQQVKAHPHVALQAQKGGLCCLKDEHYVLDQAFAMVRHGDRLDHVPKEWRKYPERLRYPNDTPLTDLGHQHAREVGDKLKAHATRRGMPFASIVSSPYLRCAQTACCIAEKLDLKVKFDLDLGEIFDNVAMKGDCKDKVQHRSPQELDDIMKKEFPKVQFRRDDKTGTILVSGKLPDFPEPLEGARIRFCYKVNKLIKKSAAELVSVIIVTHGDAVSAVLGMLHQEKQVVKIPFCGYMLAERHVKVMKKDESHLLRDEDVFEVPDQWTLKWDENIELKSFHVEAKKAHESNTKNQLQRLSIQTNSSAMSYDLNDAGGMPRQLSGNAAAMQHAAAMEDSMQRQCSMQQALDHMDPEHKDDRGKAALIRKATSNGKLFDAPRISLPPERLGKSGGLPSIDELDDDPLSPRSATGSNPFSARSDETADPSDVVLWLDWGGKQSANALSGRETSLAKRSPNKVTCGTMAHWLCRMFT